MYRALSGASNSELKRLQRPFHILCWGVPLLIVLVIGIAQSEGYSGGSDTGGWCWISSGANQFIWELIGT